MILLAPVLALLAAALAASLGMLGASLFAVQLLWRWDRESGSRSQLLLERRTYLVSTVVWLVMLLELVSMGLFVFTMDELAPHFTGAMCAVGSLQASTYGFPALGLMILVFFGASCWLVLDHLDRQAPDYPLIRWKYALVLALTPPIVAAGVLQYIHFAGIQGNVVVSCCSSSFAPTATGVLADLASIPPGPALAIYYGVLAMLATLGFLALRRVELRVAYAPLAGAFFLVTLAAVISVFAPYVYALPAHHCPFCLLKAEHSYQGYLLYLPLFAGAALGLSLWPAHRLGDVPSLREHLPRHSRVLLQASLGLLLLTGVLTTLAVLRSPLVMFRN